MIYRSSEALKKAIAKDIKKSMNMARNLVDKDLKKEVGLFYTEGKPKKYKRTGTLKTSPTTTEVKASSGEIGSYEFENYMDESIEYKTGTFTGAEVIEATEYREFGVLGKPLYFERQEDNIREDVVKAFKSNGFK